MRHPQPAPLVSRLRRAQPVARALLSLFALAWLALAMQPCVATAAQADAAGHSQHAGCGGAPEPAPAGDCPHCPPGSHGGNCGTALDCGSVGATLTAGKSADAPRADLIAWVDLPAFYAAIPPDAGPAPALERRLATSAPPRALLETYCTHLE